MPQGDISWNTRQVGRTSLRVTEIGIGTATLGGRRVNVPHEEGVGIVRAGWKAGLRYVDTAPFYGVGAAEHRVGDALREEDRDSWVLSTKVGRLYGRGKVPGKPRTPVARRCPSR